jgi:regulator of replication initiation timing
LIQNNQSLTIERNELKDEVARLESRRTSHNHRSETSATESLTADHFTYGFPTFRPADYVRTADLEAQVRIKCGEILTLHSELNNLRRLLGSTEQEVFDRLFLSGIKLNWAKCFFFQQREY